MLACQRNTNVKRIHDRYIIELDIHLVNVLANIFCGSAHTRILAKERSASGPPATTKKRYSDTTIQRYTEPEPEPELDPCINYANYCPQSPRETSVIIFSGGRAHIPKIFLIKSKCEHIQFRTYYVVDNNIYINCVQDHFTT